MKKLINGKQIIDLRGRESSAPKIDENIRKNLDVAIQKNHKSAIKVLVDWIKSDKQEDPFEEYRRF